MEQSEFTGVDDGETIGIGVLLDPGTGAGLVEPPPDPLPDPLPEEPEELPEPVSPVPPMRPPGVKPPLPL